ncbi:hypothetical protein D9758_007345 [Tetrapyrgos nigripes]|uniref:Uncharacterized protein n=1 Tax=Tetrapyrgos nigripes TaxID=182062 RepID=A0A8H5GB40_9AGAR|nr:hypothetical protein D9758_007345 [Tetrapyrgos nigripes]
MPSSTNTTYTAIKAERLFHLSSILRRAKERQNTITVAFRRTLQPSHSARRRANQIGLSINITKAVNCPQGAVSRELLPVLDFTPIPGEPIPRAASEELRGVYGHSVTHVHPIGHGRPNAKPKPVIPRIVIPSVYDARRQPRPSSVPMDVTNDFDIHALELTGLSAQPVSASQSQSSALSFPSAVTDPLAGAPSALRYSTHLNPHHDERTSTRFPRPSSISSTTDPILSHVHDFKMPMDHLIRDCDTIAKPTVSYATAPATRHDSIRDEPSTRAYRHSYGAAQPSSSMVAATDFTGTHNLDSSFYTAGTGVTRAAPRSVDSVYETGTRIRPANHRELPSNRNRHRLYDNDSNNERDNHPLMEMEVPLFSFSDAICEVERTRDSDNEEGYWSASESIESVSTGSQYSQPSATCSNDGTSSSSSSSSEPVTPVDLDLDMDVSPLNLPSPPQGLRAKRKSADSELFNEDDGFWFSFGVDDLDGYDWDGPKPPKYIRKQLNWSQSKHTSSSRHSRPRSSPSDSLDVKVVGSRSGQSPLTFPVSPLV